MKQVLSLNDIHAQKPEGVLQEIQCACLMMTIIATLELITLHAQNKEIDHIFQKNGYRANRRSIVTVLQNVTRNLCALKQIDEIWGQILRIGSRARPVRKNRSHPRRCKSVYGIWKAKQRRI